MSYRSVPKKRALYEIQNQHIDIIPLSHPDWWGNETAIYWSPVVLLNDSNRFVVSAENAFPIKTLNDLHGKRLGTILGYSYSLELTGKIERQEIIREDVTSLKQNFNKLEAGRIASLVDTNIEILWYLKNYDAQNKFVVSQLPEKSYPLYMGFSKRVPLSTDQIDAVLQALKNSGIIDEIVSKYKP